MSFTSTLRTRALAFTVAIACCISLTFTTLANPPKDSNTKSGAITTADSKLQKAWDAFVAAVKTNNIKGIKAMSTNCVLCNYCLYNSDKENHDFVDSMKKDADAWSARVANELQYVSVDRFLKEDLTDIFPADTKTKLGNKSNISFRSGELNRKTFNKFCISDRPISSNPQYVEIIFSDKASKSGLDKIFTFMETKDGYKFCGFAVSPN